ncbi:MAG: HAMP domain-containing histidine kinase [Ignavibacteriales bacterium]|nr:HAMP domain-containing histidine kinase [Ignavibacteriales bacterium]
MAKNRSRLTVAILDLAFLCFAAIALHHLYQKPFLPEHYAENYPSVINGISVLNDEEAEFILSNLHPGDEIVIENNIKGTRNKVQLEYYYPRAFIIFDGIIIVLIFVVGAFVYYRKPEDRSSLVFHLASTALATDIVGAKTLYTINPSWIGYPAAVIFFLAYTIVPVYFLHFTFVFPSTRWKSYKKIIGLLYTVGTAIALIHASKYLQAARAQSVELYRETSSISMIQNGFVFLLLLLGILNFIYSYQKAESQSDKKKIRWILYGLSIGPSPFVFFWALPIALGYSPIISEILFKIFVLFIPITFATSILKYHAMNIDLIINRSSVYLIVIGIGLVTYIGIVAIIAKIVTVFTVQTSLIVSTITATMIALSFEPIRRRVQLIVDRLFFRVEYDFRQAELQFIDDIKKCVNIQNLATLLITKIDDLLQTERIGFFRYGDGKHLLLLAHHNFDLLEKHSLRIDTEKLGIRLDLPIAVKNKIEAGILHETPDENIFLRWGIVLVFPLISEQKEVIGFLSLGQKKSGLRYSREDIDLLNSIVVQSTLTIERIELQQKLLIEQAETQRLEELSKLKSYFVSSVSHDLKTPLTSIKMFAELLRNGKNISKSDTQEYLEIIEGESERLTRLINNVLDFSRIERGVKEYHFTEIELNSLIKHVLKIMHYQFKIDKCTVHTDLCGMDCYLNADKDAVTEALINLVTNSIKYSYDIKEITISTYRKNGSVALEVKDRGIGISDEDIAHILKPFYRAKERKTLGAGGTGLGLAIVKHIMDAHNGKIEIQSSPGTGSVFTLLFPLSMEE